MLFNKLFILNNDSYTVTLKPISWKNMKMLQTLALMFKTFCSPFPLLGMVTVQQSQLLR